jgi:manganese/iron transport system substrate-binding protein
MRWALALTASVLILAACTSGQEGGQAAIKVVTSVSPITSIVENIACDRAQVVGVIPEGEDSHTYEPPTSVAKELASANLIILNGLYLEEPLLEMAKANKRPDAEIVLLADNAITPAQWKFDFSFPREQGKPNPHLWPSTRLAMEYARLAKEALIRHDPDGAPIYEANYQAFLQRLQALDRATQEAVATVPPQRRKLLTYHDSWAYWADDYGFQVIGAIQPSDFKEPSAQEVASLINQIKAEGVPAIFGSEVFPSKVMEQIARETGARYVTDLRDDDLPEKPGHRLHSYIGMMVENVRAIVSALGGDPTPLQNVDPSLVCPQGSRARYY